MSRERDNRRALVLGLLTVLMWSTVSTAFKLSLRELTPTQLLFGSAAVSALVLFTWLALSGGLRLTWRAFRSRWRLSFITALMNPTLYYLVLFSAYDRLPAQVAQPINYTWAIVLAFFSIVFLKQQIRVADIVAAVVCYLGVVVIVTGGDTLALAQVNLVGVALALGSTFIWAGYWILVMDDDRDPLQVNCINFCLATPVLGVLCALTDGFSFSLAGLAGATWVGLFEMSLAFVCWSLALRLADNASRIGNLIFIAPFLSLVFIRLVLGEAIVTATYIGLALIVAGLIYQQRAHAAN